jgi:hypothetical protein
VAITGTLKEVKVEGDTVLVTVVTMDDSKPAGSQQTTHEFRLSAAEATPQEVRRRVLQRVAAAQAAGTLATFLNQSVDLTPVTPPADDPAVTTRNAWLQNRKRLRDVKALIADAPGVGTAFATPLANLITTVESGFLPAYVDFL